MREGDHSVCVISCPAGGSLPSMARRRRSPTTPGAHLAKAAAAHAALAAGEAHPSEVPAETVAAAEPTAHQQAAARQPRTQGGKFA